MTLENQSNAMLKGEDERHAFKIRFHVSYTSIARVRARKTQFA